MKHLIIVLSLLVLMVSCGRAPIYNGKVIDKYSIKAYDMLDGDVNYYWIKVGASSGITSINVSKECFDKYQIGDTYSEVPEK